jgi:ubiquinone/menaquinone biosynthesis C-methylase UbiE
MPNFSSRILSQELLDTGKLTAEEARASLLDLRRVNRLFGARKHVIGALAREIRRAGLSRFAVLDIASGSCDLPLAILRWARRRQLAAQAFALEFRHRHLAAFHEELKRERALHVLCGNAFEAPVRDKSVDFVTCSHFLHHATDDDAASLLRSMGRWARRAVIVSDLERRAVPYYFFRTFSPLFTASTASRADGRASILQGYRLAELERIAERAGLQRCVIQRRWPFRLLLVARDLP